MNIKAVLVQVLVVLSITSCATGKAIKNPDDIRDDGKRNVVLLTHDLKLYATEKHSSVKQTRLVFRCPSDNDKLKPNCFSVDIPYLGTTQIDGFGLHAFEHVGASAIKMKYDNYSLQSAFHNVVIERVPETNCYVAKKTKKTVCNTTLKDVSERYGTRFPSPIPIRVEPGSGCYIGHLSMTIIDDKTTEYTLDKGTPLTPDKLANMSSDVADALMRVVNRPC